MIYDRNEIHVLDCGNSLGFDYCIISYGTHPCAYVRIPDGHPLYKVDYLDAPTPDCHGGITYSENGLYRKRPIIEKDGWWIGWDYNHFDDYNTCYDGDPMWGDHKRWTTEEIYQEVVHVCEQLRDMT